MLRLKPDQEELRQPSGTSPSLWGTHLGAPQPLRAQEGDPHSSPVRWLHPPETLSMLVKQQCQLPKSSRQGVKIDKAENKKEGIDR